MNFLLEVDISQPISDFNEKLLYGGRMLLIGISTVFAVLITLLITLVAFKFFFRWARRKARKARMNDLRSESPKGATFTLFLSPSFITHFF